MSMFAVCCDSAAAVFHWLHGNNCGFCGPTLKVPLLENPNVPVQFVDGMRLSFWFISPTPAVSEASPFIGNRWVAVACKLLYSLFGSMDIWPWVRGDVRLPGTSEGPRM